MATPEAQEAAARERVVKHMNTDHQDSIRRYLEYYKHGSAYAVRTARMTDVNLNEMKFEYNGRQAVIPFDPPLNSMREIRERVVQLDKEALLGLGHSDIEINKFIPPYARAVDLTVWTACILTYLAYCRPRNFTSGSLLFDHLLYRYPGFCAFSLAIQPILFPTMIAIHAFEAGMMSKKLEKHGLLMTSWVWWAWMGTCFIEGVTAFQRLDKFIAEKQKAKDAKKH